MLRERGSVFRVERGGGKVKRVIFVGLRPAREGAAAGQTEKQNIYMDTAETFIKRQDCNHEVAALTFVVFLKKSIPLLAFPLRRGMVSEGILFLLMKIA